MPSPAHVLRSLTKFCPPRSLPQEIESATKVSTPSVKTTCSTLENGAKSPKFTGDVRPLDDVVQRIDNVNKGREVISEETKVKKASTIEIPEEYESFVFMGKAGKKKGKKGRKKRQGAVGMLLAVWRFVIW